MQRLRNLADRYAQFVVDVSIGKQLLQFVNEFSRDRRKIVDEIEWVLDLMGNARRELAQGSQFLCLDKPVLRCLQTFQRPRQLPRARLHLVEKARITDRQHRLRSESLQQIDNPLRKFPGLLAADYQRSNGAVGAEQRDRQQRPKSGAQNDVEDE